MLQLKSNERVLLAWWYTLGLGRLNMSLVSIVIYSSNSIKCWDCLNQCVSLFMNGFLIIIKWLWTASTANPVLVALYHYKLMKLMLLSVVSMSPYISHISQLWDLCNFQFSSPHVKGDVTLNGSWSSWSHYWRWHWPLLLKPWSCAAYWLCLHWSARALHDGKDVS